MPRGFAMVSLCPAADHDGSTVVDPDGLLHPTRHPPPDPATGCTFGRIADVDGSRVKSPDQPEARYSDSPGQRGRALALPGSLGPWVARRGDQALDLHGRVEGPDGDAPGVHAPDRG